MKCKTFENGEILAIFRPKQTIKMRAREYTTLYLPNAQINIVFNNRFGFHMTVAIVAGR